MADFSQKHGVQKVVEEHIQSANRKKENKDYLPGIFYLVRPSFKMKTEYRSIKFWPFGADCQGVVV